MKRDQLILSSTHIDSHGMCMTREVLESAAISINSNRVVRMGLEHDMSYPPLGRIVDASVVQGKDGEFYLVAFKEYYDKRVLAELEDGTILYKEYFENNPLPFVESKSKSIDKLEISVDPTNFENDASLEELDSLIRVESGLDFLNQFLIRKSHIPDPELVIKLTTIVATAVGIVASKIPEKVGEAIGDDVVRFYKLLHSCVIGMVQKAIPKFRPITFIIEVNDDIVVELLIISNNPDEVVNAFNPDKLKYIKEKIETSKMMFNAEKIQFMYNDKKDWEINYILTADGATIGTLKSFKRRDNAYNDLINKTMNRID